MRPKPHNICRFQFCPEPTWSGKPEKNVALRYCWKHSPLRVISAVQLLDRQQARKKVRPPKAARANPLSLPLVCVFKEFEVVRDGMGENVLRVVYLGDICGKPAPRRTRGDRTAPKHPNRFGEPLCRLHRTFSHNVHAFPPEPEFETRVSDQLVEERDSHIEDLQDLMRRNALRMRETVRVPEDGDG